MNKRLVTVSEYATLKGISKQRVYQLIKGKLKGLVQEVDGVIMLEIEPDIDQPIKGSCSTPCSSPCSSPCSTSDNPKGQEPEPEPEQNQNSIISVLESHIRTLEKQLDIKDEQIKNLTEALLVAQKTTEQAQYLHCVNIAPGIPEETHTIVTDSVDGVTSGGASGVASEPGQQKKDGVITVLSSFFKKKLRKN